MMNGGEVARRLAKGGPSIELTPEMARGCGGILSRGLAAGEAEIVARRLREILAGRNRERF